MNVMFVCTGNTCRSPMAAAMFTKRMVEIGRTDIQCQSAGLGAAEGQPVSENAVKVCEEIGVDISKHAARKLRGSSMKDIHLYVVMEEVHQKVLVGAGIAKGQVYVLANGIADPYGQDLEAFRACRDNIAKGLNDLEQYILHDAGEVFAQMKK